ncbi:MAG: response regulator [Oscillospiraceae bacterium]|nr:response regulator [Oscillospiraceae bacterium]
MKKTIFIVDDNGTNLAMAKHVLEEHYNAIALPSAEKLFLMLEDTKPDLILLDIKMPCMDGFDTLRLLKSYEDYKNIPVIFLTGKGDTSTEVKGFELGVVDFIHKPFSAPILFNRVRTHLHIDSIVRERSEKLEAMKNAIISVLADIIERRDHVTGGHVENTMRYCEKLLEAMKEKGVYKEELETMDISFLAGSTRLHDIGKVRIPDSILNKPGVFTADEYEIMKTHVYEGEQIINQIISKTGDERFLHNAMLFAGFHHERWDGKGYPYGLQGTDIPLHGRVLAVVDVYDALISERPYKKELSKDEAVKIIGKESGKHFDPAIADIFVELITSN